MADDKECLSEPTHILFSYLHDICCGPVSVWLLYAHIGCVSEKIYLAQFHFTQPYSNLQCHSYIQICGSKGTKNQKDGNLLWFFVPVTKLFQFPAYKKAK